MFAFVIPSGLVALLVVLLFLLVVGTIVATAPPRDGCSQSIGLSAGTMSPNEPRAVHREDVPIGFACDISEHPLMTGTVHVANRDIFSWRLIVQSADGHDFSDDEREAIHEAFNAFAFGGKPLILSGGKGGLSFWLVGFGPNGDEFQQAGVKSPRPSPTDYGIASFTLLNADDSVIDYGRDTRPAASLDDLLPDTRVEVCDGCGTI